MVKEIGKSSWDSLKNLFLRYVINKLNALKSPLFSITYSVTAIAKSYLFAITFTIFFIKIKNIFIQKSSLLVLLVIMKREYVLSSS